MKKIFFNILLVALGVLIGACFMWVNSYYPPLKYTKDKVGLQNILKYSSTIMTKDNYSCEGETKETVGDVVASIIEINNRYKRNMLSQGCYNDTCTLSVTNCMPWQNQECGSRILRFNINKENVIKESTFTCIDMP